MTLVLSLASLRSEIYKTLGLYFIWSFNMSKIISFPRKKGISNTLISLKTRFNEYRLVVKRPDTNLNFKNQVNITDVFDSMILFYGKDIKYNILASGNIYCHFQTEFYISRLDIINISLKYPDISIILYFLYSSNQKDWLYGLWDVKHGKMMLSLERFRDNWDPYQKRKPRGRSLLSYYVGDLTRTF